MRLDHLLSKEEEVEVVLLFSYQAASARWLRGKERESLLSEFFAGADRRIRAFASIEKLRSRFEIVERRARAKRQVQIIKARKCTSKAELST